jgi:hypothetical protein
MYDSLEITLNLNLYRSQLRTNQVDLDGKEVGVNEAMNTLVAKWRLSEHWLIFPSRYSNNVAESGGQILRRSAHL